jgi:type IV fimbrial biogenesis protein FimT
MDARRSSGITLWELAAAVAIVAVLASVAAPAFMPLAARARVSVAGHQLLAAVHAARSHAIARGVPTAVCLTDPAGACLTGVDRHAAGWAVFEHPRGTWTLPAGFGARPLRSGRLPARLQVRATRPLLLFWPTTRAGLTSTLRVCDPGGHATARAVVVSQTGRPRLRREPVAACRP